MQATRTYTITLGVNVEVSPYVGLNGQKWPTFEEVADLTLPKWQETNARHQAGVEAVREARRVLQDAGLHEQAEAVQFPAWIEPKLRVRPRAASGNYTIDPFVGWVLG